MRLRKLGVADVAGDEAVEDGTGEKRRGRGMLRTDVAGAGQTALISQSKTKGSFDKSSLDR